MSAALECYRLQSMPRQWRSGGKNQLWGGAGVLDTLFRLDDHASAG
jgi:hypothetical protein